MANAEKAAQRVEGLKLKTFKECAEAYIAAHEAGWRNTLATYAYPTLGELPVAAIDTGLVMGVLEPITASELLEMKLVPREMVLGPIIPVQGLAMLYAPRGIGKTFVALSIAHAVATGGTVFAWEASMPRPVLYLDGEMPGSVMRRYRRRFFGSGRPRCLALYHRRSSGTGNA